MFPGHSSCPLLLDIFMTFRGHLIAGLVGFVFLGCASTRSLEPAVFSDCAQMDATVTGAEGTSVDRENRARLKNLRTVLDAVVRNAPPAEEGTTWRSRVRLYVTEEGHVQYGCVSESSGNRRYDQAVLEAIEVMEFVPAHRDGQAVATWIETPVGFRVRE